MRKYIIFATSFILLFTILQMLSGLFLTLTYTPDINEAWNMSASLPQETIIKGSHFPSLSTLFIAFLSASIAYVIPKKLPNTKGSSK